MGVEMKVKDVDRAEEIAEKLEKALGGPPYQVQDWYELNHNLFTALNLQKLALVIILTLIIIVAAVNMVSALTMMVTDKTREIAILKSMGSTSSERRARVRRGRHRDRRRRHDRRRSRVGLVTCYVVGAYGYHLDPKVYLIDRLPIDVRSHEVVLVVVDHDGDQPARGDRAGACRGGAAAGRRFALRLTKVALVQLLKL